MSIRARLTLVAAAAVALAVIVASFVVYFVVKDQLRSTVDNALWTTAAQLTITPGKDFEHFAYPASGLGGAAGYPQVVYADGTLDLPLGAKIALPVTNRVIEVARGESDAFFADTDVNGTDVRMLTFPLFPGAAVQIVRPLTEVHRSLGQIQKLLILIGGAGIAIAVALGLVVSRAGSRPCGV
jgi:two-component system, OmpR family, sensor histidine kinase MprB